MKSVNWGHYLFVCGTFARWQFPCTGMRTYTWLIVNFSGVLVLIQEVYCFVGQCRFYKAMHHPDRIFLLLSSDFLRPLLALCHQVNP